MLILFTYLQLVIYRSILYLIVSALNQTEIRSKLLGLTGWKLVEDKEIKKTFEFKDFKEAMEFVNKVAEESEKVNHHSDINVSYNKVEISLSTHDVGGLSEKDFSLAGKIEK